MKKTDTLRHIPRHWKDALKLANDILVDFQKKVEEQPFLEWNSNKSFTRNDLGNKANPLSLSIRHTKKWSCQHENCDGVNHIKMNLNDDFIISGEEIDTIKLLVIHELIHYYQSFRKIPHFEVEIEDTWASTQYDEYFKYATTWDELDAEVGSFMAMRNFELPELDDLDDYYSKWYGVWTGTDLARFVYYKWLPALNSD